MRTGKFITQLHGDLKYQAFTPNPLPFEVNYDELFRELLSKADQALGRLDGIAEIIPDVNFFIFMYVRKEAALSSQIEGTKATFTDLLKAEAHIKDLEIHKDVDEIQNYIKAMNYGLKQLNSLPLSLRFIKEIHTRLLAGVRGAGRSPGEFRRSQNWIGGATITTATFVPPAAHEVMPLLDNFEKFIHDQDPMPILIKAGLMHAQFEGIHPFLDGNGRIGRLLITFYLCQQGVLKWPLLYLSEFFKQHRSQYYERLNNFHGKDDVEGWLEYFLEGVAITAGKAVETARKILDLRKTDIQKVLKLGRSAEKGIELIQSLYRDPIVRIKNIERITKLSNPNASMLTKKFLNLGILKEKTGQKRNRVFSYERYIKLFE